MASSLRQQLGGSCVSHGFFQFAGINHSYFKDTHMMLWVEIALVARIKGDWWLLKILHRPSWFTYIYIFCVLHNILNLNRASFSQYIPIPCNNLSHLLKAALSESKIPSILAPFLSGLFHWPFIGHTPTTHPS
jgi:hypothetical protein